MSEYSDALEELIDECNQQRWDLRAEIGRLTAKRDAARAELARLRNWMTGYVEMRREYATEYFQRGQHGESNLCMVVADDIEGALRAAADAIHAALEGE